MRAWSPFSGVYGSVCCVDLLQAGTGCYSLVSGEFGARRGGQANAPVTRPIARQRQGHGQRIAGSELVLSPAKKSLLSLSLVTPSGPSPRLLEASLVRDNVRIRQFVQ